MIHLIGPIHVCDDLMFGQRKPFFKDRDIVESILSQEIIPKNEDRCAWAILIIKVAVPFLEVSNQLVALFPYGLFWEEKEFNFSEDIDHDFFSLFD